MSNASMHGGAARPHRRGARAPHLQKRPRQHQGQARPECYDESIHATFVALHRDFIRECFGFSSHVLPMPHGGAGVDEP